MNVLKDNGKHSKESLSQILLIQILIINMWLRWGILF